MAYPLQFQWQNQTAAPIKLRTFLNQHGVSHAVLTQIKYHGGAMLINGRPAWSMDLVRPTDVVAITLPPEPANEAVAISDLPIDIVWQDDNFLVVNKPAGVASVPAHHYGNDTLVNRVKGYFITHGMALQVPHIVTRLDKNTSGLVLFGKHHMAHSVLDRQLKAHTVSKTYLAVVAGTGLPSHGDIKEPILRDPTSFVKRMTGDGGQTAHTEYTVIKTMANMTVLRVQLHTGRTHQIRVHFASIGHPLIGDELYGGPLDQGIDRQALACTDLTFADPFSNCEQVLHADLADDIEQIINDN